MCPRRYVLKMELKKHILTHSCNDLEICGGCAKAFSSSYLQKHKPNCKNKATKAEIAKAVGDLGTEYRCDQCGLKIYGKLFLSKHMKRTHLVNFLKEFVCNKCDEVFKSSFDLLVHSRQVHRKMKVVNCEFCGRKFIKKSMLKIHQKSRACSANHFVCKTCQKPFKTKQGFENHQKFCGNEKKVLKDVKKPKEPKNWICEFCGIHLTTQPGHRRHLISRHRDVMYTKPPTKLNCPYPNCVKVFYYKFDLKNHIDCKHLKLRDYKCDLCSKGYALACGLRRHMKLIHNKTNEEKEITKIFVCSFCPAKYEKENALSKHLQHHDLTLPNRSFHCLICTRSFKLKKLLNLHIRTKHPT